MELRCLFKGIDFFEGPIGDDGKQLGLTSFSYFINQAGSNLSDPQVAVEFRNVQTGFTRTGKPFTKGGNGIVGTDPTKYCFPDYPSNAAGWSMCKEALAPQDLRFVQNSGPFTMKSGKESYITIGAVFVQPPVGSYNGCKVDIDGFLGKADDLAQNLFDNDFKVAKGPNAPELAVRELDKKLILNLVNPITSNNFQEAYAEPSPDIPKEAKDNKYKFEGYLVYQLISPTVTSSELEDPSKAKLLMQCDIKNDIKDITNEGFVDVDGVKMPVQVLKVKGSNNGIVHSIEVTEDLFQTLGVKNLVNNKEYYFASIAYSSNYYNITKTQEVVTLVKDTFGIDRPVRSTVTTIDKQKRPFLAGSNLYVASAIPHMSDVNGVEYKAKFGQGIPVTRVLGKGNGGVELDLLDSTYSMFFDKDNSLKNLVDNLEYKGGASPVKVRVTDPRSLQDVDFELQVVDSSYFTTKQQVARNSSWFVLDKTNNDTLFGERDLTRPNEQIMYSQKTGKRYGISIEVGTIDSTGTNPVNKKTCMDS
ncbi:MAG: hypothetical protein IPK03_11885 [Bacteroidetes bacterium]|nr:hypothetical protein [Bacteroidota bacterium]